MKKILSGIIALTMVIALLSGAIYIPRAQAADPVLVGLWHFDEGMGPTANDSSGNNNDGTLMGGTSWTSGKFGNSLSFDGSNGYVLVADDDTLDFGTGDFTVEAWINVRKSALVTYKEYGVVNKNSYFQGTPGWGIEVFTWGLGGDFGVICYITNQTSWVPTTYLSVRISSMTADVWHHIAQVRTGTTLRLYFDGELVGTKTHGEISGNVNNSQPVIIGDHSWGPNFPGLIDEVRIWGSALSQSQLNDMTPPVITITTPIGGATYLLNQTVLANWSATDINGTGVASASGTVPSGSAIDTGSVGTKHFTVTATDYAKNEATKTVTYIVYGFSGILPPIKADGSSVFKFGSTVPVKFQLQDDSGNFVTDAIANISLQKFDNDTPIGDLLIGDSTSTASTGNQFRYDPTSNQYIFNLATKDLFTGTWKITITVNIGGSYSVKIGLK